MDLLQSQNTELLQKVEMLESELIEVRREKSELASNSRFRLTKGSFDAFDQDSKNKSACQKMELEKLSLLETIRSLEISQEKAKFENRELLRSLSQRTEHNDMLEGDRIALTEKIRHLQSQLMEFESAHSSLLQERSSLKSSLAKLEGEKMSIEMILNDIENTHGRLLTNSNSEKEDLK